MLTAQSASGLFGQRFFVPFELLLPAQSADRAHDDRRRALQREVDECRHQQKELGGQIAQYKNPKSTGYQRAVELKK